LRGCPPSTTISTNFDKLIASKPKHSQAFPI
jgi:hypothetical protein